MKSRCAKNVKFPFSRELACCSNFIYVSHKEYGKPTHNVYLLQLTHCLSLGIYRFHSQQRCLSLRKEDGDSKKKNCTYIFIRKFKIYIFQNFRAGEEFGHQLVKLPIEMLQHYSEEVINHSLLYPLPLCRELAVCKHVFRQIRLCFFHGLYYSPCALNQNP